MKKLIILVALITISGLNSFADNYWEKPIFMNNTNLTVTKINITTQAQGDAKTVELKKNNKLLSLSKENLSGKLGGYFENSSIDEAELTNWYIEIVCIDEIENIYYFNTDINFSNYCSEGPALSFWPRTPEICLNNSKLILENKNSEPTLSVEICDKKGNINNFYKFKFDEKKIETNTGRTLLAI